MGVSELRLTSLDLRLVQDKGNFESIPLDQITSVVAHAKWNGSYALIVGLLAAVAALAITRLDNNAAIVIAIFGGVLALASATMFRRQIVVESPTARLFVTVDDAEAFLDELLEAREAHAIRSRHAKGSEQANAVASLEMTEHVANPWSMPNS